MSIFRAPDAADNPSVLTVERPKCRGCGEPSPSTDTNYTLISAKHGWRLVLESDVTGRRTARWSCPACWAKQRDARRSKI